MNWTVEVTHAATGEEMRVGVEAASRQQAEACARDGGFVVRDCYRAGRGIYKATRNAARIWAAGFCLLAVVVLLCGLGGVLATPGDSGTGAALRSAAVLAAVGALGILVARAMTDALRRDSSAGGPRGFDVVPARVAPPDQPSE
jgi:hypothetical protein